DEHGQRLFQVLKFEPPGQPKTFRQRTGPNQVKWSIAGVRIVPFMLPELLEDLAQGRVVFVVEGEKDVLTLRRHGIPATCNPMGAGKWWPEFNEILRGADVVLCGDHDQAGRDHVALVAGNLKGVARRLRVLDLAGIWPGIKESDDVSDWFDHGDGTPEKLWAAVDQSSDEAAAKLLTEAHAVFRKWLDEDFDLDVVDAVLATGASERLSGDPLWLLIVSGPGYGKTETARSLSGAGAHVTSTIASEGALLSATPRKDKAKGATGGLLRKIEVLKFEPPGQPKTFRHRTAPNHLHCSIASVP